MNKPEKKPAAVFGLLVVYCLKDIGLFSGSHGLPGLIAIVVVVLLWKRQMLLSIAGGTVAICCLCSLCFDGKSARQGRKREKAPQRRG